jgi:protein TonB
MIVFPMGDSATASLQQFFTSGAKKSEVTFSDYKNNKKDGAYRSWYRNGNPHKDIAYNEGKLDGVLKTWWENGKLKREDVYKNDTLVSGTCYDISGIPIPHFDYEVLPQFPGGETALYKFLIKEIKYPTYAIENDIQGKVYVSFFVDRNGNILESSVIQSPSEHLSSEALRVINKMPKWEPGKVDGIPTSTRYNLPVSFVLK